MHKCEHCGTEFEGSFCPECGAKYEERTTCPECGAAIAHGAKFCASCGHAFSSPAPNKTKTPLFRKRPVKVLTPEEKNLELAQNTKRWVTHKLLLLYLLLGFIPFYGTFGVLLGLPLCHLNKFNKYEKWSPDKLGTEHKLVLIYTIAGAFLSVVMLIGGILVHTLALPALESNNASEILSILIPVFVWFGLASELAAVLVGACTIPLGNRLVTDYYGKSDPIYGADVPAVTVQELIRCTAIAEHEHTLKKSVDGVRLGALGLIFLYCVIIAIAIPVSVFSDLFRIDRVKKIALGSDKIAVQSVLGAPYVSPGEEKPDDYEWIYVSGSYQNLEKRAYSLAEEEGEALLGGDFDKMMKLEEELQKLEEEAKNLVYKSIRVCFDGDGNVTSVVLDMKTSGDTEKAHTKQIDGDVQYSATTCSSMDAFEKLYAGVTYGDGSYYTGYITPVSYKLSGGKCTFQWYDPFGKKLDASITIVGDWLPAPEE